MCGGIFEQPEGVSVYFPRAFLIVARQWMVLLAKPSALELSTWIGVADCGCPIPRIKVRIGTVSWPLMYTVPISDSATEPITFDIICEMEWMGPFRCGRLAAGVVVSG